MGEVALGMRIRGATAVVCVSIATSAGSLELLSIGLGEIELLKIGLGEICRSEGGLGEAVAVVWDRLAPADASMVGRRITVACAVVVVDVSVPTSADSLVVLASCWDS